MTSVLVRAGGAPRHAGIHPRERVYRGRGGRRPRIGPRRRRGTRPLGPGAAAWNDERRAVRSDDRPPIGPVPAPAMAGEPAGVAEGDHDGPEVHQSAEPNHCNERACGLDVHRHRPPADALEPLLQVPGGRVQHRAGRGLAGLDRVSAALLQDGPGPGKVDDLGGLLRPLTPLAVGGEADAEPVAAPPGKPPDLAGGGSWAHGCRLCRPRERCVGPTTRGAGASHAATP